MNENRQRILGYLERNPDRNFTPKQIANWTHLTERTVLKHLLALVDENVIHEVEDSK